MKTCSLCETEKPLAEFNKGKSKDGHSIYCRECDNAKGKDWYDANKFKISDKKYVAKEPIDCSKCRYSSKLYYKSMVGFSESRYWSCYYKTKILIDSPKTCSGYVINQEVN
jgi:hypothetical protein